MAMIIHHIQNFNSTIVNGISKIQREKEKMTLKILSCKSSDEIITSFIRLKVKNNFRIYKEVYFPEIELSSALITCKGNLPKYNDF